MARKKYNPIRGKGSDLYPMNGKGRLWMLVIVIIYLLVLAGIYYGTRFGN